MQQISCGSDQRKLVKVFIYTKCAIKFWAEWSKERRLILPTLHNLPSKSSRPLKFTNRFTENNNYTLIELKKLKTAICKVPMNEWTFSSIIENFSPLVVAKETCVRLNDTQISGSPGFVVKPWARDLWNWKFLSKNSRCKNYNLRFMID